MKLDEYIKGLLFLQETYGTLDLVYSKDDEGNEFRYVNYLPSLVNYNEMDKNIISEEDLEEYSEDDYTKVICIN